jgi:glycosyltransferase involved in cell wall biosynthesis
MLEKELGATFYFADRTLANNLQKLDYGLFKSRPKELKFLRIFGNFNWIAGSITLPIKLRNNLFVITGEPFCLSSWMLMIVARLYGKKIYTWTHGWNGGEHGVKKFIKKTYLNIPNGNFIYGDYAKDLMIGLGFDANRLWVVYNSLHYQEHLGIRKQLNFSKIYSKKFGNSFPTICFIGRLTKQKKLGMLLEAQSICEKRFTCPFNIIFIGTGPEDKPLKLLADKNSNEGKVLFFGACYEEIGIAEFIYNADLCVSPGEVGLTAIHVLSYGTPVITHDNFVNQMPEFEAIKENITGDFFEEDNVEDLALKIYHWFEKYPVKTDDLIRSCFNIIDDKFNPKFQLQVFKKVFEKQD